MVRYAMVAALCATSLLGGCVSDGYADRPGDNYRAYDYNRPDPNYGGYDAGRYYCRRNDGTTGLIVGGIAGGVLGNIIAPGGSNTLGTILGAAGGAVAGRAIEKGGDVKCK